MNIELEKCRFVISFSEKLTNKTIKKTETFVKVAGIAGILFFDATGIYGIKKMFDNNVGLTINDNGILDNTNDSSFGFIKWADITEIRTEQFM